MAQNYNGHTSKLPRLRAADKWKAYDALSPEDKEFFQQIPEGNVWPGDSRPLLPKVKADYWIGFVKTTLLTYGPDHPQASAAVQRSRKVELSLTDLL